MKTSGAPRVLLELSLLLICEGASAPVPHNPPPINEAAPHGQPAAQTVVSASMPSTATSAVAIEASPAATAAPSTAQSIHSEPAHQENGAGGDLQQWWAAYLQRMREKAPRMATMLVDSQIVIDSKEQATIFVRSQLAEQSFSKDEKRAQAIAEAIAKQLQLAKIYVRFKVKPDAAGNNPEPPPAEETAMPTLEGQGLIDGIKETFNGREIN